MSNKYNDGFYLGVKDRFERLNCTKVELAREYNVDEATIRRWLNKAEAISRSAQFDDKGYHDGVSNMGHAIGLLREDDLLVKEQLAQELTAIYHAHPTLKVAVLNDIHFPDHDPKLLDIVLQVLTQYQPDLIIDGSDVFAFSSYSRYPVALVHKMQEEWDHAKTLYLSWRRQLKQRVPDHKSVFLVGNHDYRFYDYVTKRVPEFQSTLLEDFIDVITSTGSLWGGWTCDTISINNHALITHGTLYGQNTAKKLWNKMGSNYLVSIQGHTHKDDYYSDSILWSTSPTQFERRVSEAYVTGCLCLNPPHYSKSAIPENWTHSFALLTIDQRLDNIDVERIQIKNYSALWRGMVYSV